MQRVAVCKPTSHGMFMRRRRVTQSSAEQSSDSAPEKDCHTKREEMVKENRLEQQRTCRKKNGHRRRIEWVSIYQALNAITWHMHKNASAKIAVGICSVGRSHGGTRPVRRTFYRLCGHAEIFASTSPLTISNSLFTITLKSPTGIL